MADKAKLVSNTRIFLDMRTLLREIIDLSPNFPRMYRDIPVEMRHISITLIKCISHAYITHDRAERIKCLESFQSDFETLKMLVRESGERQWIKGKGRHAHMVEIMDAIGKQCSAWKNSLIKGMNCPE